MDPTPEESEDRSGFSIPVRWVAAVAAALAVLAAVFYGGMAYERQRDADLATVSGLGERRSGGDSARPSAEPGPLELQVARAVEVEGPDGTVMVTLDSVQLTEDYVDDRPQRYIEVAVTIGNLTGERTVLAPLDGHFEDRLGQRHEHVLTTCIEDPQLPTDPVPVGRFVKGCESMSIPDDAGRVVLDGFTPALYVEVPAT